MRHLAAAGLLLASATAALGERGIPAHPRSLSFAARRFEVPAAERYRHLLSNGVEVTIAEDHSLPLVEVAVALRGGDYLDDEAAPGVAGLTAALLRRGGTASLTPEAFDERADALAVELETSAGSIRAGASLSAPRWVLAEALDLFFEMLRAPRFDPARLALAKGNLREAMKGRTDDPLAVLEREWGRLLFGGQHFGVRELKATELDAITREQLIAFHQRYWSPKAMVLAVSGDVEVAPLLADLERRFAGWPVGEAAPWPPRAPEHRVEPGLYYVDRPIPQGKVLFGHLGARRRGWEDRESAVLALLSEILGGSAVSRINGRLRTVEGLAYRSGASFGVGDAGPGEFRVFLESKSETVALAVKLALEEVERLRRHPPAREELALAKKSLVESIPYLFDSAEEIAGYFAEDTYLGRPHSFWSSYRERIEAITPEEIQLAAEQVLDPARVVIVVVGNWKAIEPGDPAHRAAMRQLAPKAVRLPERDPLTLEGRP